MNSGSAHAHRRRYGLPYHGNADILSSALAHEASIHEEAATPEKQVTPTIIAYWSSVAFDRDINVIHENISVEIK